MNNSFLQAGTTDWTHWQGMGVSLSTSWCYSCDKKQRLVKKLMNGCDVHEVLYQNCEICGPMLRSLYPSLGYCGHIVKMYNSYNISDKLNVRLWCAWSHPTNLWNSWLLNQKLDGLNMYLFLKNRLLYIHSWAKYTEWRVMISIKPLPTHTVKQ